MEASASLDQTDLRILEVLQQDASLENQEVASRVHLSPAACLRRVRRLRETGVISKTVALVDAARVGLHVQAYAFVSLENHRPSSGDQFEGMVMRRPEVVECVRLSGGHDFLVRIAVESMRAYSAFLDSFILPLPAVRSVNTSFELGVLKRTTALPVVPPPRSRRS
jgi:Lrp/AsnC family leucine-responsive transcriptional regulator